MKIYTKMWEFWVHLDYNHFYIPLTSKYGKFQPQTIFLGNNNPFSIKPTVVRDKIPEDYFAHFFQSGRNSGVNIWAFDATRGISW